MSGFDSRICRGDCFGFDSHLTLDEAIGGYPAEQVQLLHSHCFYLRIYTLAERTPSWAVVAILSNLHRPAFDLTA